MSADQGPKTFEEEQLNANKEEKENKIQCDNYDRQIAQQVRGGGPGGHFGGPEARGQHRPLMTGRPSQDDRPPSLQQFYKNVRGILNKMTPSKVAELSNDFLKLRVLRKKESLGTVIDIIFDKAVEEPQYCPLYSDLCKKQVKFERKIRGHRSDFLSGILTKCQETFETKREESLQQLRKDAEAETDEKKKVHLLAEWEEAKRKERRRMFGNIEFIGQLYRNELVLTLIVQWCVVHLFQRHARTPGGDEESVECAVRMLETVGKIFDRDSAEDKKLAEKTLLYFQHLQEVSKQVSNRIRFSIENLIEMRNNNWIPRKSADQVPKTLKEVHADAKMEELANNNQRNYYDRHIAQHVRGGRLGDNFVGLGARSQRRLLMTGRPLQDGHQGPMMIQRETSGALSNARRNKWTTGAGGGGGHRDAASHALWNPKSSMRWPTGVRTNRGGLVSYQSSQPSSRDEMFDEMMYRCAQAPPSTVFRLLMKAAVEETLSAHDRRYTGQIIGRCLQADHFRVKALKSIAHYARSAVEAELWIDVPKMWENMAEVLLWATLCDMKHFDGPRPSLDDFAETFQTAQQDTRKPHVLLTLVLKRMFESLDEKGAAQMAFAEMRAISPDTPDLIEALKATTVDGTDLYTLLTL
uniref:MIF4G domain-containing protein n=1 Tax=Plectus sambesii TaxID=2011161 RepID=A0A914WMJ3_9BILA